MTKKFVLFLMFIIFIGNYTFPFFAMETSLQNTKTEKSFWSKLGDKVNIIVERLAQGHEYESIIFIPEKQSSNQQPDNEVTPQNSFVKTLVQNYQQEQRVNEALLQDNPVVKPQEIVAPKIESTLQTNVDQHNTPQAFVPALRGELSELCDWGVKTGGDLGRGAKKGVTWFFQGISEVAGWCSDRLDEYLKDIENQQKEYKENLRRQKVIEKNSQKLLAQAPQKDIPENYQDNFIKQPEKTSPIFQKEHEEVVSDAQNHKQQELIESKTPEKTSVEEIIPGKVQDHTLLNSAPVYIDTEKNIENTNQQEVQAFTNINIMDNTPVEDTEVGKLFGISCDKTQLMYFGAGAIAIIVICGVTYVLYKHKDKLTLEKVSNYVRKHKFAVSSGISVVCAIVLAGIYAKQQGMTLQSTGNWMASFLGKEIL